MDNINRGLEFDPEGIDLRDFRVAIESREQPTLLVDRLGKILFANDSTLRLTSMTRRQIAQTGFLRMTMPAFRGQMMRSVAELRDGNRQSISVRCMLDIERLRGRWIVVHIERIDAPQTSQIGFLVTLHSQSAERSGVMSSYDLLGMASHEIRSTLMALQGAIRMREFLTAKDSRDTDAIQELDDAISRNLDKLLYISNDLIEYSSIESGGLTVRLQKVDLQISISDIISDIREAATINGIRVEEEGLDQSYMIWADPVRLSQVMHNLLGNSIKYCQEGAEIKVHWQELESGRITIRVTDNGPGLPKEVQDNIFSPFNKGKNSNSRSASSGLGLCICQLLMQAMGGTIRLVETEGAGACFELELAPVNDNH